MAGHVPTDVRSRAHENGIVTVGCDAGDKRAPLRQNTPHKAMRALLPLALAGALVLGGCISPFGNPKAQALEAQGEAYNHEVSSAVQTLGLVFGQADESVKAFQQGWLAPEGAASEFGFLRDQVKAVKANISTADPPPVMEDFHRQLGRSVSLTQQAMDAMQEGFTSGDGSYFELAHEKLNEARKVLDTAVRNL
jgi:outer membrane murein-binding lipoprotein Lpp